MSVDVATSCLFTETLASGKIQETAMGFQERATEPPLGRPNFRFCFSKLDNKHWPHIQEIHVSNDYTQLLIGESRLNFAGGHNKCRSAY